MRVGIDLGTTYSLISRLGPDGQPQLIPDQADSDLFHTPSVVHVASGIAMVGRMAELLLEQNPELKVIRFFKRYLGQIQPLYFDEAGSAWYAETVAALVIKKLRFDAESYCSQDLEAAVITVPAHFNDLQRKAVHAAAMFADLSVLELLEEPVAAALHYGVGRTQKDQIVMVYDFGGGTFDATILSFNQQGIQVLAKSGLTDLGGKEFDEAIGEIILEQFNRTVHKELSLNARGLLELRRISEEIKIKLSLPGRATVRQTVLLMGRPFEVTVGRLEFERRIQGYIDLTEREILRCVKESGVSSKDVNVVLLVGGSSMVPAVTDRVRNLFRQGQKVDFHEPSKAVALGAAIRAGMLSGEGAGLNLPPEFRGVSGYAVGVRAVNPESGRITIDVLVKQNTPLPAKVTKVYYTTSTHQDLVTLDFVQSRLSEEKVISLGQLIVGPIAHPRANYPIEVSVHYQEDSTVAVRAYDPQTRVELNHHFKRKGDDRSANAAVQRALVRSTFINHL